MAAENFGVESFILAGKQTVWNEPLTDVDDLRNVIYEPISTTLRRMTEPRSTARLKGNRASTKNTQGMVMADGNLSFFLQATQMGFWIEQVLHATSMNPTAPSTETIRTAAAVTAGTAITTGIMNPNEVLDEPTLSGQLIFTFASLTGTGNILIQGTDHNEFDISEEVEIDSDAELLVDSASSYDSIGADDIDTPTIPTVVGLIFSGASGSGSATITGTNFEGVPLEEVIDLPSPTTISYTDNVFQTVTSITVSGVTGGTLNVQNNPLIYRSQYAFSEIGAVTVSQVGTGTFTPGNLGIEVDPLVYTHNLSLSEDLGEGLTVEVRKGAETPVTYHGMLSTTTTITLAEAVTMEVSMIGRDGRPRKGVAGTSIAANPTDPDGFSRPSVDVMPDWGMAFEIEGVIYPITEATITINHNIDWPEAKFNRDVHYPKPVFKGEREFTMTATIDYTNDIDMDALAYGVPIEARILMATKTLGGVYRGIEFEFPNAELVDFPDPEIPDQSDILQTINMRAYTVGGTGRGGDEVTATLFTSEPTLS